MRAGRIGNSALFRGGIYRFNVGPRISLPLGIFGIVLLMFFLRTVENRRTMANDVAI